MTSTAYAALIRAFLAASAPGTAPPENLGPMEFAADGITCAVFPLEGERQLMIQALVMDLGALDHKRAQDAMRLLHGLNWLARHTTGVIAMVDGQDRVQVSKTLEIGSLEAARLGEEMAVVMEAAAGLAGLLQALPATDAQTGGDTTPERIDPRFFA